MDKVQLSVLSFIDRIRSKTTNSQQKLLLCEAHECSSGTSYNPYDLNRCVASLAKQSFDKDMVAIQKYDMISFEIQLAHIHIPPNRASFRPIHSPKGILAVLA